VWASGSNAPLQIAEDARLREGSEFKDAPYGQYGWDWGISFSSFSDLTTKLQGPLPSFSCGNWWMDCDPLKDGELLELAINCHGGSGCVDIDCHSTSAELVVAPGATYKVMDISTLGSYSAQFAVLNRLLAPDHGVLFFMCCMTGQIAAGTEFLEAVSKLLPERDIMAIATIGYSDGAKQIRHGKFVDEPGMRDTDRISPAMTPVLETAILADWNDLTKLPWASRNSPHTKIARNGAIVGGKGSTM